MQGAQINARVSTLQTSIDQRQRHVLQSNSDTGTALYLPLPLHLNGATALCGLGSAYLGVLLSHQSRYPRQRRVGTGTTMSQYYQNNRRPRRRNNHGSYNGYNTPGDGNWQDRHHREDDQIAPSGVSASTHQLQRWALVTADMLQQPAKRHKSRVIEEEMRERIQRRYECPEEHRATTPSESSKPPVKDRSVIDLTADHVPSGITNKRARSPSPAGPVPRSGLSTAHYVQSIKRARSRSPSPIPSAFSASTHGTREMEKLGTSTDKDECDYYYQSSEWSFPSSDEEGDEIR